jgi:hypothetical protein
MGSRQMKVKLNLNDLGTSTRRRNSTPGMNPGAGRLYSLLPYVRATSQAKFPYQEHKYVSVSSIYQKIVLEFNATPQNNPGL